MPAVSAEPDCVLPSGDAGIAALLPRREQLAALGCVLAVASDAALEIANDKDRTLQAAAVIGIDKPTSIEIDNLKDLAAAMAELDFPFVLKPTVSWTGQAAERVRPIEVADKVEAVEAKRHFLAAGARVLAQQWACGRREGVTLFVVDDRILASFAYLEHRTTPPPGEVEFHRDAKNCPLLMEINARPTGTIENAARKLRQNRPPGQRIPGACVYDGLL